MTAGGRTTRQLLLVEDNPGDAELLQDFLCEPQQEHAQSVTHVSCLATALSQLASAHFDAVILDLFLPDCSGIECVKAIRIGAPEVPIVVLTGVDDAELALLCIGAGAQDYLPKQEMRAQSLNRAVNYAIARALEASQRQRADSLQRHLAAIVEASRDGIVSTMPDGSITSWNRGAEQIFGYTRTEVLGRSFQEVIHLAPESAALGQDRSRVQLEEVTASREPTEVTTRRKDGAAITLSLVACNLCDATGQVVGLAAICRDMTESKRRDDELQKRNQELVERDQQMRALTARLNAIREEERTRISREVHDELGQLMTALKMDLRWIAKRLNGNTADDAIAVRIDEATKLVERTLAGVQRIAIDLRPTVLDALGLAAAVRDEARRFEKRTGVRMHVLVDGESSPAPEIATALFRIFQELLTNVARHARAQEVHVWLDDQDGFWTLRVEDDGVGIRAEDIHRPTSLGLLGMRERTQAVGGIIHVAQRSQGGTVATVRIPRKELEEACASF